ncbi:MAG: hypothetical protein U5K79_03280 [Cyclobacteriaceae bacterium]|nr:hypothetical protein [Cyclobacteriaceae bacterium]
MGCGTKRELNHYLNSQTTTTRRHVIKNLISLPLLGGFVYSVAGITAGAATKESHLQIRPNLAVLMHIAVLP